MNEEKEIQTTNLPVTNSTTTNLPSSIYTSTTLGHLGKILFVYSILGTIYVIGGFLAVLVGGLALAMFYLLLIMVVFFTLGLALLDPNYLNLWTSGGDALNSFANFMATTVPYVIPSALALSIITLVFLCLDKYNYSLVRVGFTIFNIILLVICLVFQIAGMVG